MRLERVREGQRKSEKVREGQPRRLQLQLSVHQLRIIGQVSSTRCQIDNHLELQSSPAIAVVSSGKDGTEREPPREDLGRRRAPEVRDNERK